MVTFTAASLPRRATLWHDESTVSTGNAITRAADGSQIFATYAYQNAAANGDVFTQSFWVAAGVYTFNILGVKDGNSGKVDWRLDGTIIASGQDWYAASTTYNTTQTISSIVIATDGYHVLTGTVNGKHASSAGYALVLTRIEMHQAAD